VSVRTSRGRRFAFALAAVAALGACGGGADEDTPPPATPPPAATAEAVRVTEVNVGDAIGTDRRVTSPSEQMQPADTVYASVVTQGSASNAQLTARWTFEDGQVVDETSQTISPTGTAVTEFHISNPSGWPAGNYQVEILLNGARAQTKSFTIR
jgi:hypothetical protein